MKSIVILIDYFGSWPKWFPVFLASCKSNSTVNWILRTDCEIPQDAPSNVRFIHTSYASYIEKISSSLDIKFKPAHSYKICDARPMCGDIFYDDIKDYDYFGFGDLDVIYGDIRKFYTDEVLSFDVISTHAGMISGHLSLFKNTERLRKAYLEIHDWKEHLENPESTRFDEDVFSSLFFRDRTPNVRSLPGGARPLDLEVYDKEQYSTVFHPMRWHDGLENHPDVWFWKDGAVTNHRNSGRDYLYLHLMNFQSMRWTNAECRERQIPWKDNPNVRFTRAGEESNGVRIDWTGIQALRHHK
jgi:hypothetical protein